MDTILSVTWRHTPDQANPCLTCSDTGRTFQELLEELLPAFREDGISVRFSDEVVEPGGQPENLLELCYTGCGRIDGFIDLRGTHRVTDAAARILICTEAGGRVSDRDGSALSFPAEVTVGRCLVASNGLMHEKIIEYLR